MIGDPLLVVLLVVLSSSATLASSSRDRNHFRRFLFDSFKTNAPPTTTPEDASVGHGFSSWLSGVLSGGSHKDKQSDSFSKLALLRKFLSPSSSSSSSSDKGGKLDKLFQVLSLSASDDKNKASSSTAKLNQIMGFFNGQGSSSSSSSSSNLQLAMKLLSLSQGSGGLSSFSGSDLKSLMKFASG